MGLLLAGLAGAAEQGIDSINKQQVIDAQAERDAKMVESQKSLADYNSELMQTRERESAKLRQEMLVEEENRKLKPEYLGKVADAEKTKYTLGAELRQQQTIDAIDTFRQKSAAELEAEISKLSDPKFIAGTKAFKNATRDTSSDALHSVQLKAAQIALEEKQAEVKMPYADRQIADSIKEQLKAKSAVIDKVTADSSGTPEGIDKLQQEKLALSTQLSKVYEPFRSTKSGKDTDPPKQAAPQSALDFLAKNPDQRENFIKKYGASALPAPPKPSGLINTQTETKTQPATFDFAGYSTLQGAIDGAAQGNSGAVDYLKSMPSGGISIQQRQQIKKILKGK